MKIRSFLKIYHANKIFLENLPFNSMEIDIKGTVAQDFGPSVFSPNNPP
jgi:hypothetical protein